MHSFIRNCALSALIGVGSLSFAPSLASAQTLQLQLGQDGPRVLMRQDCEGRNRNDPGCRDRRDRRDHRRDERYGSDSRRDDRGPRSCTPDRALEKAERMGVRRARIMDVGRRTIDVGGRSEGRRIVVTFSRERGCPVIR
ncbi:MULTISPECIES: hypothetical protein [unclassified Mesorhizobium]|jgi:hypothetical protein|uniref:hypothetical protein n=1 Tax=unclassified Mesorhizobium TaxID=325217 RepID=UPI0008EE4577|nr:MULTISPECIES: hypothetical protein [unclassified Mesorhizobium]RJG43753.1 hypothetical protein D3Y55_05405 [Mesorhizobium sp. DCY119]SFT46245.1 hypothetical protein SAMN05518861_101388 [Mesorhizobium sp. YR577]